MLYKYFYEKYLLNKMKTKTLILGITMAVLMQLISCELRFVFTTFRHGARAPEHVDANNLDILGGQWSSPGELTPVGYRMHYLLGVRNKARYSNFLSSSFDPKEVYALSSEYNRTMMSAQAQLNGMFPPGTGPSLNAAQQTNAVPPINKTPEFLSAQTTLGSAALPNQMQIFPLHLRSKENKMNYVYYQNYNCEGFNKMFVDNMSTEVPQQFLRDFKAKWGDKIKAALGVNDQWFTEYMSVFTFMDTFASGYTEGYPLTKLVNAGIDLVAMNETVFEFHSMDIYQHWTSDPEWMSVRMTFSQDWIEIFKLMDRRVEADRAGQGYKGYMTHKYVMYSGHDVSLSMLIHWFNKSFGSNFKYYTPYASNLFVELYRPDTGSPSSFTANDYTVRVIYNDHNLYTMRYPDFKAGIEKFYMTYDEAMKWCNVEDPWYNDFWRATIILGILLGIALVLLVIVIICCKCCGKKEEQGQAVGGKVLPTV